MLIGCDCHCAPESSGSSLQPPSESASSSEDIIDTVSGGCALGNCIDGVVPVRYRMRISYAPPPAAGFPCCEAYSQQTYLLTKRPMTTGGCLWLSGELPKQVSGTAAVPLCSDAFVNNPDFRGLAFFQMKLNNIYYPEFTLTAGLFFQTRTGSQTLLYHNIPPLARPFNCLAPITLYHRFAPPLYQFDKRVWTGANFGAGPCRTPQFSPNTDIPLTIGLEPA